jgi:RNA ligase (TIGR02306 family)
MSRRLATIETISGISEIPGADAIERARVRGWDVVVKKGEFAVGDACVYHEVDSMLDPSDPRYSFLKPTRTLEDGLAVHVLRTMKLRGQYSQGLALPLAAFPELGAAPAGTDVTDTLGIKKWDPPIPANLSGQVRGNRPSWIPMTDEERIQNLPPEILAVPGMDWKASEKLDGSSASLWSDPTADDGVNFGVCSRNLDLVDTPGNTLWGLARSTGVIDWLADLYPGRRVVLQGEAYGERIQGNPLRVRGHHLAAFALRVDGVEIPRGLWPDAVMAMSVPVYPDLAFPTTVDEALAQVDKIRSLINPDRLAEGVVWRSASSPTLMLPDGRVLRASFKAIDNAYLAKLKD